MHQLSLLGCNRDLMPSPVPVWSCLPASCSRSSLRGPQAAGTAESGRTGRQRGGERSLRTVRVHSRRIRQAALSLQRQQHCSSSRDERGETKDGCRETDGWEGKKSCCSHPSPSTAPMRLSLRLSPNFSTPPRPLCWLHATSPSLPPLPHLPPPATPSPLPPPLSPSAPPSSLPAHLSTRGCVCRLRHFFIFFQSVCEDQTKVLQCRLRQRVCM